VPAVNELPESTWTARFDHIPGLQLDKLKIIEIVRSLAPFASELSAFPAERRELGEFYWNNVRFTYGDTAVLYGMVRKLRLLS
jgi:hypothetical protein